MSTFAIHIRASVKDRLLVTSFVAALVVFVVNAFLVAWKMGGIGAEQSNVALHYSIFFGVDRVGDWKQVFYLPILGGLSLAVNFALAIAMYSSERFVSHALGVISLLVNLLLIIGTVFVIITNM
ncbi:MAG: hypothetical protein WCJ29_03410 [bacterium]